MVGSVVFINCVWIWIHLDSPLIKQLINKERERQTDKKFTNRKINRQKYGQKNINKSLQYITTKNKIYNMTDCIIIALQEKEVEYI